MDRSVVSGESRLAIGKKVLVCSRRDSSLCACVCVKERERERENDKKFRINQILHVCYHAGDDMAARHGKVLFLLVSGSLLMALHK